MRRVSNNLFKRKDSNQNIDLKIIISLSIPNQASFQHPPKPLPKLLRAAAIFLFKPCDEIAQIIKSHSKTDFRDRLLGL